MRRGGLWVLFMVLAAAMAAAEEEKTVAAVEVKVGVVLNPNAFGKMGMACISMALSDFYASRSHYKTKVILKTVDSNGTVVDAAAAALDLIKKEEVQAIIGPETSMQANFVIDVGAKAHVPIISFSATRPSLTSHRSSFFFRAAQDDASQVKAIGSIVKAYKWRRVVPIYVDDMFGDGIIPYLIDALQNVNTHVPYQSIISPTATDDQIIGELYKLMTMQTRVFIVHMLHGLASRIFIKAKQIGMMNKGYVWIVTNSITNELDSINHSIFESMQGVIGIKTYVPRTQKLEAFEDLWRKRFLKYYPTIEHIPELDVFGLWAYDAAWALAIAVEEAGIDSLRYSPANVTALKMNSSNYLHNLGVNQNGVRLRDRLSNVTFDGLAGKFVLRNGQLESAVMEIVNVIGNGRRNVGFWSPESGLTRVLEGLGGGGGGLKSVIWPGDPGHRPKGWEVSTAERKLRVVVPVKDGFWEFVSIVHDAKTNTTKVSGYCIEVFKAVIEALPYAVGYELIPFHKTAAEPGGTYNDLVYQIYLGNFDALVGDLTIRANRSKYIDYTLPFAESGVSLVVPIKSVKNTNAWVFIQPLKGRLWSLTGGFFLIMALVVWVLEHRINEDFRGHPLNQICTSLWYSFSTMVFAHREITFNNWTRFAVIIWLFVVLIITQSYTASLASYLTVQDLKPAVTDIHQLQRNGEFIGHKVGSFIREILKSLEFDESQLRTYRTAEELHELLSKGSSNGGISAAMDEIPYIKLFLAKYCSQYTTTEPTYKADGFGFGFPIGSPLVSDISRAILEVTESDRMREIENAWFKKVRECSVSEASQLSSTRLSVDSFWALFVIVASVSAVCIICYMVKFLYDERGLWWYTNAPKRQRFHQVGRKFMDRDARAYRLQRRAFRNGVRVHPDHHPPAN
ncbi:glutamate receptor 2.1-like [Cucurbita pepo subsp. pepo]|uniref:glutamate receptor 2.1-like n=1 Tax=Cucurbita pepo subsp. pepo TaxID=3664 RepID=UPI000C9D7183|nr:glutamate receptor 2.1-like [Cucurbita pepo subsp. pepo]